MKNIKKRLKETFIYNLMSSGLGVALIILATLIIVFHDYSCNRTVKMKEDVLYIKPN